MNISATTLVLLTALITAGSTLIGVAISSFFNLRTTRITKESEERKHQRELIIKAATDNWRQAAQIALASPHNEVIPPLDTFIIHMLKFSELLVDEKIDSSNVISKLTELRSFMDKVHDWFYEKERIRRANPRPEL